MTWTGRPAWYGMFRAAFLIGIFVVGGCAPPPQPPPVVPPAPPVTFEVRPNRIPLPLQGDFMVLPPEATQQKYECMATQEARLVLEELQIIPESVKAGSKINQIVSYAFCPSAAVVRTDGRLVRVVSFEGKQLLRDVTEAYEFKPGIWAVGAFITIPPHAKSGAYALDVTMTYQHQTVTQRKLFFVQASLRP